MRSKQLLEHNELKGTTWFKTKHPSPHHNLWDTPTQPVGFSNPIYNMVCTFATSLNLNSTLVCSRNKPCISSPPWQPVSTLVTPLACLTKSKSTHVHLRIKPCTCVCARSNTWDIKHNIHGLILGLWGLNPSLGTAILSYKLNIYNLTTIILLIAKYITLTWICF